MRKESGMRGGSGGGSGRIKWEAVRSVEVVGESGSGGEVMGAVGSGDDRCRW